METIILDNTNNELDSTNQGIFQNMPGWLIEQGLTLAPSSFYDSLIQDIDSVLSIDNAFEGLEDIFEQNINSTNEIKSIDELER